jgi:phospholipase A-2-activating protein
MVSKETEEAFILQADGCTHTSDVRFVSTPTQNYNTIFSASRDNTAKWITVPEAGDTLTDNLTFIGHTAFVNFVLFHPNIELLENEPCIVTGSNDHHLALWNPQTSAVEAVLDGHNSGICCGAIMSFTPDSVTADVQDALAGDIVSGDWGGMVIIFDHKSGRPKQLYEKHATAIRGVAQLTNTTTIVSCSGDKTIHAWDATTGTTIQVFSGHKDVVQCICAIDGQRFASAGNDCTIRLWHLGAENPYQILEGHDSLVYSVCWSPLTSELYSSSEDHTVRVWRSGAENAKLATAQVIQHPCVVWSVAVMSDGRIVTGGSDHTVRVWTRDYDHMASIGKLEALEAAVSSQTVDVKIAQGSGAAAATGGLDVALMPYTHEIHQRRGQHGGERLFARNEKGEVELYVWNLGRWEKIGVVVAGPDAQSYTGASSQRREKHYFNGETYDYLFDVDVEGRMLKLPYRVGDGLVETAKRFIQDNRGVVTEDSQEEIQNFLMQHISPEDLAHVPGLEGANSGAPPHAPTASPAALPAAPASPSPNLPASPASALLAPWTAPQTFDTFNPAAAQTKVNSLLSNSPAFQNTVGQLAEPPHDAAEVCRSLVELYNALPSGSRFPAIDALRYLLVVASDKKAAVEQVLRHLTSVWDPLAAPSASPQHQQLPTSAAEWMVSLRLAACVVARVCDQHTSVGSLESVLQSMLVWLVGRLPSMTNLLTNDTPAATRGHCKAATAAIFRNAALLLSPGQTTGSSTLPPNVAEQLALAVVRQSAVLFVSERSDSSVVRDCLCSLRTLLMIPTGSTNAPSSPSWRAAVVAQMQKSLVFSLRSIATGAYVEGQSTAVWLLTQMGSPIVS